MIRLSRVEREGGIYFSQLFILIIVRSWASPGFSKGGQSLTQRRGLWTQCDKGQIQGASDFLGGGGKTNKKNINFALISIY